jgi:iron complex outermembrane receptor protein
VELKVQYLGYKPAVLTLFAAGRASLDIEIRMVRSPALLDEVVISAGRYEQKLSDVMVSMELIKPARIANTATTSLEQLIRQTPGVEVLEDQPSIRGGSGYSYGAGSRVLLLMDDLPLLSGDAGDVKWDYLPLESISRIEIIKGASSVLYGSSALNGIIHIRSAYPLDEPDTRVTVQSGIYMDPSRQELVWWDRQPLFFGTDVLHSRKIKNADLLATASVFRNEGYREDEYQSRGRLNLSLSRRHPSFPRLSYGIRISGMLIDKSDFLVWRGSGSGAYRQNPDAVSALSGHRFNIDPFLVYRGNDGGEHSIRARYFRVGNDYPEDMDKNNASGLIHGEYKFHRKYSNVFDLTAGLSGTYVDVFARLYGDHRSFNQAAYAQLDVRPMAALGLSAGMRFERYSLDNDVEYSRPVFRAGLNYQLASSTFLRASFGQGYRFPSVAEKFTATQVGSLNVFPNPDLGSERGWSSEIGIKQGLKFGQWYGYLDLAGFWTEYRDMIEFNFGIHGPDTTGGPTIDDYGFRALNIGDTRITGFELSLAGEGRVRKTALALMAGYTFMHPVDLESEILKYRYMHSFKFDTEMAYRRMVWGITMVANSRMESIDEVFLNPLYGNLILPGFPDYWEEHHTGYWVIDARFIYRVTSFLKAGLAGKNLFNREYMGRPGDIQPPRNLTLRLSFDL